MTLGLSLVELVWFCTKQGDLVSLVKLDLFPLGEWCLLELLNQWDMAVCING